MILAPLLLLVAIAALALVWNRIFSRVEPRFIVLFTLIVLAYQAQTLFTSLVDLPGNLAFVAQPWKSLGRAPVRANTGIVFTQLAPWTASARRTINEGALPLWNRTVAGGAPLMANQQTAVFHPFTIVGLPLTIGDAWTLSVGLRLFSVLFFSFIFLRHLGLQSSAASFGAIAYTFATFHIIWLLFPLGLATMALPVVLAGIEEYTRHPSWQSFLLLTIGFALPVLGGHPESAAVVFIIGAAYGIYRAMARTSGTVGVLAAGAAAVIGAVLLTAFFWYPTWGILRFTERYHLATSAIANPIDHGISGEWLLPLVAPNILGTPQAGNYRTPPARPGVLSDYGEVASGYAGIGTLAFALAGISRWRDRPLPFFLIAAVLALVTLYETPGWNELVRSVPLLGDMQLQRLRIIWILGVCVAAAFALDGLARGSITTSRLRMALIATMGLLFVTYFFRLKTFLLHKELSFHLWYFAFALIVLASLLVMLTRLAPKHYIVVATILCGLELLVVTRGYNPPARPRDVYPNTGAIKVLQRGQRPYRIAALGWSLLPDTPGYYGLEDVKTTDPISFPAYLRLNREFLGIRPGDYDQIIQNVGHAFFDYLNIRYVYVPPEQHLTDKMFRRIYSGPDGEVFENTELLPRYFFPSTYEVQPTLDVVVTRIDGVRSFLEFATVDHVPQRVRRATSDVRTGIGERTLGVGGKIALLEYSANQSVLQVEAPGWNLLVSSDVAWPGWRAYWNGVRVPTVVVNGSFVGVFVPPGRGTLRLLYRPKEVEQGLTASITTFFLLMIVTVLGWIASVRSRREAAPNGGHDR